MSILVSGGAGYIGSHTCVELLAAGYDIVVADNFYNSCPKAVERIKLATRRYAKRQRTWFRKDARIRWLDATSRDIPSLVEEALELLDDGVA